MTVYITKEELDRVFTKYEMFDEFCDLLSAIGVLLNIEIHIKYHGGNDD